MTCQLLHGDCLELMRALPDASVDMALADPPYGTTACKWDAVIPFVPLWAHLKRIVKPGGTIVLTASQPFTTALIASNLPMYKYCWYWEKPKGPNFALTGFQPLKVVEEIVVFSDAASTFTRNGNSMTYNPQKTPLAKPYSRDPRHQKPTESLIVRGKGLDEISNYTHATPRNLLYASTDGDGRVHPTQKPVALLEYLIRTYTHEAETVLDFCMGSGSAAVAAIRTNRNFIGMEQSAEYMEIARARIEAEGERLPEAE